MIKLLSTSRLGDTAFKVHTKRKQAAINRGQADSLDEAQLHHLINKQLAQWLDLFIHKNSDGSMAIAFGEEPDIWPEDEKDE